MSSWSDAYFALTFIKSDMEINTSEHIDRYACLTYHTRSILEI